MNRLKKLLITGMIVLLSLVTWAQDQNYCQFFNNDLYYNPAFTGLYPGMRASVGYRNQWTNLPVDFKSYNVAVDMAERALPGSGGIGLMVHNNNEGEGMLQYTLAALTISTRIPVNENLVTQFGISAGVAQRRIDWNRLVFSDQLDGMSGVVPSPSNFTPPESDKVVYPDFNVGTVLNYINDNINARVGGAFHHIFTPKIGFIENETKMPMKFVAHGDLMFIVSESSIYRRSSNEAKVNPGVLYENQQGANAFSVGVNGFKSFIYLGLWYRNEDINLTNVNSMIFMAGLNLPFNDESRIKLMYSYDYVLDKLSGTGGTHEFSLIVEFDRASIFGYKPTSRGGSRNGVLECPSF